MERKDRVPYPGRVELGEGDFDVCWREKTEQRCSKRVLLFEGVGEFELFLKARSESRLRRSLERGSVVAREKGVHKPNKFRETPSFLGQEGAVFYVSRRVVIKTP